MITSNTPGPRLQRLPCLASPKPALLLCQYIFSSGHKKAGSLTHMVVLLLRLWRKPISASRKKHFPSFRQHWFPAIVPNPSCRVRFGATLTSAPPALLETPHRVCLSGDTVLARDPRVLQTATHFTVMRVSGAHPAPTDRGCSAFRGAWRGQLCGAHVGPVLFLVSKASHLQTYQWQAINGLRRPSQLSSTMSVTTAALTRGLLRAGSAFYVSVTRPPDAVPAPEEGPGKFSSCKRTEQAELSCSC